MTDINARLELAEEARDTFRLGLDAATKKLRRQQRKIDELTAERDRYQQTIIDMGQTMEAAVNALRGAPPDDCSWSTHDLAELAAKAATLAIVAVLERDFGAPYRPALNVALDGWEEVQAETKRQAAEMIKLMNTYD